MKQNQINAQMRVWIQLILCGIAISYNNIGIWRLKCIFKFDLQPDVRNDIAIVISTENT